MNTLDISVDRTNRFKKIYDALKVELKLIFAIESVMINIIALILGGGLLILIESSLIPNLGKWHQYFYHGIQILLAYQVIKSANKSFILPLVTILTAFCGIYGHHYFPEVISHTEIYKEIMLVGVLGAARSIWNMS